MAVTIKQIAESVGLSHPAVSQVLNGKGRMSEATRRRVIEASRAMGYRPNGSAQAMRRGRYGNVALVLSCKMPSSPLFSEMITGIEDVVDAHDLQLVLARLPDEKLTSGEFMPRVLRKLSADGLLLDYTHDMPARMVDLVRHCDVPAVWLNSKQPADAVHPDDLAAGRTLAEHLLGLGHRRIAYADYTYGEGVAEHYSAVDRYAGYARAMAEAGLPTRRLCGLARAGTGPDLRMPYSRAWLSAADRPTAVVAYAGPTALPIVFVAKELGLRVPEDLSVATFVEPNSADYSGVDLTSMVWPERLLGRTATRVLLDRIAVPAVAGETVAVPFDFHPGGTAGPAPATG